MSYSSRVQCSIVRPLLTLMQLLLLFTVVMHSVRTKGAIPAWIWTFYRREIDKSRKPSLVSCHAPYKLPLNLLTLTYPSLIFLPTVLEATLDTIRVFDCWIRAFGWKVRVILVGLTLPVSVAPSFLHILLSFFWRILLLSFYQQS